MNLESRSRVVVGLMSGTSLDGVDAAITRLSGSGRSLSVDSLGFITHEYPPELKDLLKANSSPGASNVKDISQLNVRLAHQYAESVRILLNEFGHQLHEIDAIGCHGQTLYHLPTAEACAGKPIRSTLQIGDPSTLAQLLNTVVVGDFRLADMAVNGQGAPLASYFDYIYFSHDTEARGLLNIGGIANMTILPEKASADEVTAFDTGPGNMIIDALAQRFWHSPYDPRGVHASRGAIQTQLLQWLINEPYYRTPPPKSTGREFYNESYIDSLIEKARDLDVRSNEDIIATATALTAEAIAIGYESFVRTTCPLDRIIVSGGGIHNIHLMELLKKRLPELQVDIIDQHGIDADEKEAICFAVLAHETLNGVPSSLAAATGADRPAILGKICLPG